MNTGNAGGTTEEQLRASTELGRGAIVGRYLVIGLIGKGGMGEVYAAYDPELDRKIALKLLRPHTTAGVDPSEGRARLLREAQAIARLSDPNVVVVFDVGTFADRVFLAMEFVDGNTLGYWLQAQPRTWREVVAPFIAAGRGLACAHRSGVVHRDFKPDNVMIGRDGKVRVMDFGLARSIASDGDQQDAGETAPPTTRRSAAREATSGQVSAHESSRRAASGRAAARESSRAATVAVPTPSPSASPAPGASPLGRTVAGTASSAAGAPGGTPWTEDDLSTRDLSQDADKTGLAAGVPPSALDSPLTVTGAMMGTPAYMAPEQFRDGKIDGRTDQFSFCVALYEGLYGERPYRGKTIHELTENVLGGQVSPAPPNAKVPGWLRRTLLRGLRVDPAARHPSMEALLLSLGRDPARTRRRWAAGASVTTLIVLLAAGLLRAQRQQRIRCLGAETKLAGIWELPSTGKLSPRKEAIRRAFMATGKRYAADSFTAVMSALDRYVVAWADMHRESCEATNIRGDQSAEVLDLRTMCLQDRFSEVRALTNVFNGADGDVVSKSVQAVQAIRPVEQCADIAALRAVVHPPDDPALRREVADVRTALADVKALAAAGRYKQAQTDIVRVTERARRTKYDPVIAETLLQLGQLQQFAGAFKESEKIFNEVVLLAEGSSYDELVAEGETYLVGILGYYQDRASEAVGWARHAEAILKRIGPGHDVIAGWRSNNLALVYQKQGMLQDALENHLEGLRIKEMALGGRHFDVGLSQGNVALALFEMGRIAQAIERNQLALRILKDSVGPDHPSFALILQNGAEFTNALGEYAKARSMAEKSLAIFQREFEPNHPYVAYPLNVIGSSYVDGGEPALAIPSLERALRILENSDPGADIGVTRFALARALWESGKDRERGLSLATLALADCQKQSRFKQKATTVAQWIEARRTPAQRISMR